MGSVARQVMRVEPGGPVGGLGPALQLAEAAAPARIKGQDLGEAQIEMECLVLGLRPPQIPAWLRALPMTA